MARPKWGKLNANVPDTEKVMRKQSIEKLRERVQRIESKIIEIAGYVDSDTHDYLWMRDERKKEQVEELLSGRCALINRMWNPTDEAMEHFRRVNDQLLERTEEMHARVATLWKNIGAVSNPAFDDDVTVEAVLKVCCYNPDSILRLSDDEYYGSNFGLMACVFTDVYDEFEYNNIEYSMDGKDGLNDGTTWDEPPFRGRPEFDDIVICHAVHDLCNHKSFTIPDLIRINRIQVDTTIVLESTFDNNGNKTTRL